MLLLPHIAAYVYLGMRLHDPLIAVVTIAISLLLVTVIVVEIQTGLTSSNWGTYTRTEHPAHYWVLVCAKCLLYLGMIAVTLQTAPAAPDTPTPDRSLWSAATA